MTRVEFTVLGIPIQQGSSRAFVAGGKAHIVSDTRRNLTAWRTAIATEARAQQRNTELLDGPVRVTATFRMPRPASHFAKSGAVRTSAPSRPASMPDLDKLARALLDSLTSVLFLDDRQVVELCCRKVYTDSPTAIPGAEIVVSEVVA